MCMGIAACASLPVQGPSRSEINEQGVQREFVVVPVTEQVSRTLSRYGARGFGSVFKSTVAKAPSNRVGVGDILAVRILEASDGGLFSRGTSSGTGNADFSAISVDESGYISLPYVGQILAAGRTPNMIQDDIVTRLEGKAIQPQAVVNIVRSVHNSVTIAGDVFRPGKYELSLRGDQLSDAISGSGGSRFPAHETTVTVIRDGQKGSMSLYDVLQTPRNNISLQRGDLIVLTREPRSYTISGAVARGGAHPFAAARVSIMEAVAASGGLHDARADPTGVFVFRFENRALLRRMKVEDLADYPSDWRGVPTIYQFNMREAKSHFYAQSFMLADKDAIYVSNAESVQLTKLLKLIDSSLQLGVRGVSIRKDLQ